MGQAQNTVPTGLLTTRIGHFSNPDVLYSGTPTGEGLKDNRKTLTYTSTLVAAFQLTPSWFAALRGEGTWFEKRVEDALMTDIRIGDFDGDGQSDAFRLETTGASTNKWFVSFSASGPWTELWVDTKMIPLQELRFADFNGDGKTDVFHADVTGLKWFVWRQGLTNWDLLNTQAAASALPVSKLCVRETRHRCQGRRVLVK
jgi:hypothetical protein